MANYAIVAISGFLFWALAARTIAAEELGFGSALISTVLLVGMIGKIGLDFSLLALLPRAEGRARSRLLGAVFLLTTLATTVVALVTMLGAPIWASALRPWLYDLRFAAFFVSVCLLWSLGLVFDFYFTAAGRSELALVKNAIHGAVRIIALPFCWSILGIPGIVLAAVGTMAIGIAISIFALWRIEGRLPEVRPSFASLRSLFPHAGANYVASLALTVPLALGTILILEMHGPTESARFYVLWLIGTGATMVPGAVGQIFSVRRAAGATVSFSRGVWFLVGLAALSVWVLGPIALSVLGPTNSVNAGLAILPYALTAFPSLLLQDGLASLRAGHRNRALVIVPLAVLAAFTIGLLSTGAADAAGWAWLGANVVGAVLVIDWRRKR